MKWTDHYYTNRPLFNSILTGVFYFLFSWSLDYGDSTKSIFISLMLFLPGLTFPLTTCYYRKHNNKNSNFYRIVHFILSVGIYHGAVWLFSADGRIKYITILAGLLGSLLFQLMTKFILRKEITLTQIALTSILSGLSFLPYELSERLGIFIGIAICLWTIINGFTLNKEYREATYR